MTALLRPGLALAGAGLLLSLTACGGGSTAATKSPAPGSTATGGASGDSVVAAAAGRLKPYLTDPGTLSVTDALTTAPAAGKSIYFLVLNVPATTPAQQAFKAAAAALKWKGTVVLLDPSDAGAAAAGAAQAVAAKADYIVVPSGTIASLGASLDMAKKAGIPVIDTYSTDDVGGKANGIYANPGGKDWVAAQYPALVDWAIVDAKGKANFLYVGVPDIPILDFGGKAVKAHIASSCSTCSYTEVAATPADLGAGNINSLVVSSLQQHPDINYIYCAFGDIATGLPAALKAAGLGDKMKIIVASVNPDQVKTIPSGVVSAALLNPQPYATWLAFDVAVRLDQGVAVEQLQHTMLPIAVADATNVPSVFPAGLWEGPADYKASFTKLWKLS